MRKLKWKKRDGYPEPRWVCLNDVSLDCFYINKKWRSAARFNSRSEFGTWFNSLKEAQEDCIRLAKQMLTEHHECLARAMKSFDVDSEEN